MIKMLASILLELTSTWAARDVVMSDMFEMFKSEQMVVSFNVFFQNDYENDHETEAQNPKVRFQMCSKECEFLTTADKEQDRKVFDTKNFLLEPLQKLLEVCQDYDRVNESNQYPIFAVIADLEKAE